MGAQSSSLGCLGLPAEKPVVVPGLRNPAAPEARWRVLRRVSGDAGGPGAAGALAAAPRTPRALPAVPARGAPGTRGRRYLCGDRRDPAREGATRSCCRRELPLCQLGTCGLPAAGSSLWSTELRRDRDSSRSDRSVLLTAVWTLIPVSLKSPVSRVLPLPCGLNSNSALGGQSSGRILV